MLKFIFISAIIWFLVIKLLRFKFVVYKGPGNSGYQPKMKTEGRFKMNNKPSSKSTINANDKGDYIDYEEVK